MNEDNKREVAIFRFGVIHDFVSGVTLDWGEQVVAWQKGGTR